MQNIGRTAVGIYFYFLKNTSLLTLVQSVINTTLFCIVCQHWEEEKTWLGVCISAPLGTEVRGWEMMSTWRECGTADAGTCSQAPPQTAAHGSSSGTWQTLRGNPENKSRRLNVIYLSIFSTVSVIIHYNDSQRLINFFTMCFGKMRAITDRKKIVRLHKSLHSLMQGLSMHSQPAT